MNPHAIKRLLNTPAFTLAVLHLLWCAAFFAFFFSSHDPQRAIFLVLMLPIDPWIVLVDELLPNEAALAVAVSILGTVQWWYLGAVLGRIWVRFRNRSRYSA